MFPKHIAKFSLLTLVFLFLTTSCQILSSPTKQVTTAESYPDTYPTKTPFTFKVIRPRSSGTPTPTIVLTETDVPTVTKTISPNSTPTTTPEPRLDPADWQEWPVIPTVSAYAKSIYQQGLEKGNFPDRFSKIGDCQNITTYFLAVFDDPDLYSLGSDYAYLQDVIDHFSGSYSRESVATAGGMNVASVLSTRWTDKERCNSLETPLACELRLNKPSIVLISMEETWGSNNQVENYEKYMRQVLDTIIEFGAVPIIATKASNLEGGHQINQVIVNLAYEYDIPMWNFWLAVQPLNNHGLLEDGFHLTHGANYFDDPSNLKQAWPVRNLTALQVIDAVWRELSGE